jgi:hypothetical protein
MSILQEQIQRELEAVQLAMVYKQDYKTVINNIKAEFESEIAIFAEVISEVYRTPSDVEEKAYGELLRTIDPLVLSENVFRAIFDRTLSSSPESRSPTIQDVVTFGLIERRLKSLLPIEESAIKIKWKFRPVDRLVSRCIIKFPQIFKLNLKNINKKQHSWITLTEKAIERLGKIPLQELMLDSPMLCKPKPWTSIFDGGFLTPEAQRGSPLIRAKSLSYQDLRNIDRSLQESPEILEAVNKMQSIAYRIDPNYQQYQKTIRNGRVAKINECNEKLSKYTKEISDLDAQIAELEKCII